MTMLAIDLETYPITETDLAPKPVCIAEHDSEHSCLMLLQKRWEDVHVTLASSGGLVGHNIAYDLGVLWRWYPETRGLIVSMYQQDQIHDTKITELLIMIANGSLFGERRPSLADLSMRHLGEPLPKDDAIRLQYHTLDGIAIKDWPQEFRDYALKDAEVTWRVHHAQPQPDPKERSRQVRADWVLHQMACIGIGIDRKAVQKLAGDLDVRIQEIDARMQAVGMIRPDGTRNMQVIRDQIVNILGQSTPRTPASPRFPDGQVQTSSEVLELTKHPDLMLLSERSGLEKLHGFVDVMRDRDVFHPSWNVLVSSGRTSCGSESSPGNIQNQPRKGGVRECWQAREGFVFAACDWSNAELRALAQVTYSWFGHSRMREILNSGVDLHQAVADSIGWIDRQGAKALDFGIPGGLGPATLVQYAKGYGVELTVPQAADLRRKWLAVFPEMEQYFVRCAALANGDGVVEQFGSGRKRGGLHGRFPAIANTQFQGLVADAMKTALWEVWTAAQDQRLPTYGSRIVACVHDELILEVPIDVANQAARDLHDLMIKSLQEWLPDMLIEADVVLMDHWYKSAKPCYDESGKLIPWVPNPRS